MTSIVDINLADVPDLEIVEPGEYKLVLRSVEIKTSKEGNKYINTSFRIEDEPNAPNVYYMMMLPDANADDSVNNSRKRKLKTFYQMLGAPLSGEVDLNDYVGEETWAILGEEAETAEFPAKNFVRRFITE